MLVFVWGYPRLRFNTICSSNMDPNGDTHDFSRRTAYFVEHIDIYYDWFLDDKNESLRATGCRVVWLSYSGSPRRPPKGLVQKLEFICRSDPSPLVRFHAISALNCADKNKLISILSALIESESDPGNRAFLSKRIPHAVGPVSAVPAVPTQEPVKPPVPAQEPVKPLEYPNEPKP